LPPGAPNPVRKKAPRQPLLWAAIAFSAGILIGSHVCRTDVRWLTAACIFGSAGGYFIRRRVFTGYSLVLFLAVIGGALSIQIQKSQEPVAPILLQATNGSEVFVAGHVIREGTLEQKDYGEEVQKIDIETEQISSAGKTTQVRGGLRITVFTRTSTEVTARPLKYGDRLRFPAKLALPRNYRNPGAFDYEGYLSSEGIIATGSTKFSNTEVLPGFAGSRFELWRTRLHRSLIAKIHSLWPTEPAALIDTIMLGDDTFLGRDTRTNFQRTGTYHVLVVSGLKVGILALAIFWLLRRLRINEVTASALTVLLMVFYAVLTDVGTPVWRATLMIILYLVTGLLYRNRSILNTIGAAALTLLAINPAQLFTASFQLSFLCVLIIGGIASPILERTTKPITRALRNLDATSYDLVLSPKLVQVRLDLRMVASRFQRLVGTGLATAVIIRVGHFLVISTDFLLISVLLQAGFVLPMAYYFHRATIVSLPANIIVVPLTQIIMVGSGIAIAIGYLSLTAAKIPVLVTTIALRAATAVVHWMGSMRIADARVATPELWIALAASAALLLAMIVSRFRPLLVAASLLAITATALWISIVPPAPAFHRGVLELTAIDVGQGDSILLVSPEGRTLLVDAGGLPVFQHSDLDIGEDVVSPYLWSRGMSRLDAVAITHAHADHLGGMASVISNFRPRELWLGVNSSSPELQRIVHEANESGIPVILHGSGEQFAMGGATVRILAPRKGENQESARPNDTSLVMKVSYFATSALLEGDAEKKEESLVSQEEPQANLLKVAHHGSLSSTSPDFLASVHPRFAIISVGARNLYGHPRKEILNRLANAGVRTYRTDKD